MKTRITIKLVTQRELTVNVGWVNVSYCTYVKLWERLRKFMNSIGSLAEYDRPSSNYICDTCRCITLTTPGGGPI